jgi:hypothetical protein
MRETPMTASSPNVIEIKLDRLIDDMRLLRSQMIAYDRQLKGIEASLNSSEPSEQQPDERFGRGTGQLPQAQHFNRSPKGARRQRRPSEVLATDPSAVLS